MFVRAAAAALVVLVAAVAVQRWCVRPWQCASAVRRVKARSELLATAGNFRTRTIARDNLDLLRNFEDCCGDNVEYLVVKGGNQFALSDFAGALATYRHALTFDRRPELYLNIGLTQLNLMQTAEATETLMTGSRFNFAIVDDVPDPVKTTIYERTNAERKALETRSAK